MKIALFIAGCLLLVAASPLAGTAWPSDFVLLQLRIPRTLMGFLVGAVLGMSGALYQCLFDNPLATPSTVGTTGGAALGALAATIFWPQGSWFGLSGIILFAFLGALAVTALIAAVAWRSRARVNDVLLAGIAISLAAAAIGSGLKFTADMAATMRAVRWSLGNLAQVGFDRVAIMAGVGLIAMAIMLSLTRALVAMAGGEEKAMTQGANVLKVRTIGLSAGSLGLGAAVALTGPIAFVGLIVPHIIRQLISPARHTLLMASGLGGGTFLVICDTVARLLLSDREIPVGVITAAIGAPLLIFIVARQR